MAAVLPNEGASGRLAALLASRRVWLLVLAIGVAVRLRQYLGCASYWYDEAFLLLNVFRRSFGGLLGAIDYQVPMPPAFLWLERLAYLLLGPSELAMRLPTTLQSLAALLLLVPLARRLAGDAGLWAVALLALSAHAVMHGVDVRPYIGDVLFAEVVFLAAHDSLAADATPRRRALAFAGLLLAAALVPWLSFPGVFVLGGASLALLAEALRRRSRPSLLRWASFNVLLLASVAALYLLHARHLYYPGLQDHWCRGFPDTSSPLAALRWTANCLIDLGHYASTGLGIPLALLALCGLAALARRSWPLALLLAGPIGLGLAAAFLRRYPMDDRLLLFTAPSVWLLAALGLRDLLGRLPPRRADWAGLVAAAVLIGPGLANAVKDLAVVNPRVEFRGAFDFVHRHWAPGDRLWVGHAEVYETYFGRSPALLGGEAALPELEQVALRSRLWLVYTPSPFGDGRVDAVLARLGAAGCVAGERHSVRGLRILLFTPPAAAE
jgi:4-amino-4-deoxy-L-arabinose transferase-like glycosyltransferase